jgi:hypothetical protein
MRPTELGVLDALPGSGAELAEAWDADAGALTRVLRGLAAERVVDEADGRFATRGCWTRPAWRCGASCLPPRRRA